MDFALLDDEPVDPKQDLQEWFKAPWKEFMSMNADDRYEDALRKKELKNKRRRELYAKSQEEKNMQEPQSDCNRAFLVDEDTEPRSRRRRAVSATKTKQVAKEIHGENIQIRERKSMRFVGVSSAPSASNHDVTLEDGQLPTSGVVSKSPECTVSERELDKLKHALMLLSEAEKHLRLSSEQSTWFTVTLLQLGSAPSPDRSQLGSSRRQSFKTNEEHHMHTFREAITQKQRSDAANSNPNRSQSINEEALAITHNDLKSGKTKLRCINSNSLIDIWVQCVEKCHSRTLRHLLHTFGKLVSISEVQGGFVAYIAFADCNIKTRAEGFLSSIMNSFEIVLRCNVEVKIILLPDLFGQQQMDPINSMKGENKSICSSAIEANLETAPGWLVSSR
ncbi:protein STICHEL [Forsythia ovata]|uniref:Protein STICHEL n=1 Tax=Forsythia ovata TaxID=205694 RepID=A0ABD1X201_9LAMI